MERLSEQLNGFRFPIEVRDGRGNRVYYERLDGYWYKRECDSQGNEIYYENSKGNWYKNEWRYRHDLSSAPHEQMANRHQKP